MSHGSIADRTADSPDIRSARIAGRSSGKLLVRLGFAAKGVLYLLIAVIALRVAAGGGGQPEDQQGALRSLRDEPLGTTLLVVLGIGLVGYALWGLVEAIRGPGDDGAMGAIERVGGVVRAVIYGSFAALAFAIVFGGGSGGQSGGRSTKDTTANALDLPLGRWLVLALGVLIIAVAGYDVYRAVTQKFLEDLDLSSASRGTRRVIEKLGSIGFGARGVAYGLIGFFLAKAAVQYDPKEAVGLDGALQRVAEQPYGMVLLGLMAAGLLTYAIYAFTEARYHHL